MAGVEEFFFGFDVDEDFGDAVNGVEDAIFDAVRDGVAGADGDVSIDDDVEVDVVAEADLAYEALLEANDAGDEFSDLADMQLDLGRRRGIEDLGQGRLELAPGAEENDGRSEEGGPVVHTGVLRQEGERDANEGEEGRDGVAQVMPCVDADGGALNVMGYGEDIAPEQEFDGDDDEQDPEGVNPGEWVRMADKGDAFAGDGEGRARHGEADDGCGDGFGLAVAVGMHFIGRAKRDAQADVDNGGAENVRKGFNAVGDEGEGMADEAGEAFAQGEEKIRNDAEEGRVESPVHVEFRFGGGRHERSLQTQILRWWEEQGSENRDQRTGR